MPLKIKTKTQLAEEAFKLAHGYHLVRFRSTTYIPADYETRETSVPPAIDRTIWLPLNRQNLQQLAAIQFETLFANDAELRNFDFMVAQNSQLLDKPITTLLVKTPQGLRELDETGSLEPVTGEFRPNTLLPTLNDDPVEKDRVYQVIVEWLDSEEEAESLLRHLATSLAPGWPAVKYVLLLGEGRNGKGVLLDMLAGLFGRDNVSNVTRQAMAAASPVVTDLNGKLLNVVWDGQAEYLKDSGYEKSLIAGEQVPIRQLYESTATPVQTNALFIEGLQQEPKSHDKSTALQKRLVRFHFPNVYPLNHKFRKSMLTEESLGAFLALLVDRYVTEDEVAEKLAPTAKAIELQLEYMHANSLGLQFLRYVEETDPLGTQGLLGLNSSELTQKFHSWRLKENDLSTWAEPDVLRQFQPLLNTERKSVRINNQPRKVRVVTSFKDEAAAFIKSLEGEDDAALLDALVDD